MNHFRGIRSFKHDDRGISSVEFALIVPVLVAMFFGAIETSEAVIAKKRLEHATNTFVDLLTQEEDITPGVLSDLAVGVARMAQIDEDDLRFAITSVSYDPADDRVEVDWSVDQDGNAPRAAGEEISGTDEETIRQTLASLVIVEAEYDYQSSISNFYIKSFNFKSDASRLPRYTNQIRFCPTPQACPQ